MVLMLMRLALCALLPLAMAKREEASTTPVAGVVDVEASVEVTAPFAEDVLSLLGEYAVMTEAACGGASYVVRIEAGQKVLINTTVSGVSGTSTVDFAGVNSTALLTFFVTPSCAGNWSLNLSFYSFAGEATTIVGDVFDVHNVSYADQSIRLTGDNLFVHYFDVTLVRPCVEDGSPQIVSGAVRVQNPRLFEGGGPNFNFWAIEAGSGQRFPVDMAVYAPELAQKELMVSVSMGAPGCLPALQLSVSVSEVPDLVWFTDSPATSAPTPTESPAVPTEAPKEGGGGGGDAGRTVGIVFAVLVGVVCVLLLGLYLLRERSKAQAKRELSEGSKLVVG